MQKTLYQETQRFNTWWIWLIIIVSAGFSFYPVWEAIQSGEGLSNDQLMGLSILGLVFLLFLLFRLETQIEEEGIYVRFFPFHLKKKFHSWDSIAQIEVVKYSPLMDFGGWGIRWGRKGKAYSVKGKWGIQLVLKDGDRLLIGTQNPEDVDRILKSRNL